MSYVTIKKSAFSAIELLVVMAILGILISLLSPSLRNAIQKTESLTCARQLQNLNFANSLYYNDHDDQTVIAQGANSVSWDDDASSDFGVV
jgi:prepilin-type N-terminal cleavage/methylation domain-containing protein